MAFSQLEQEDSDSADIRQKSQGYNMHTEITEFEGRQGQCAALDQHFGDCLEDVTSTLEGEQGVI